MRTFLRVAAGVNAVFQGLLGVVSVARPTVAAGLFQLEGLSPPGLALIRIVGGLLAGSGLLSAVVAKNPEANPALPVADALACLINLVADTLIGLSGAMRFSQLAPGMLLQAILVVAVVAGRLRARAVPPASRAA